MYKGRSPFFPPTLPGQDYKRSTMQSQSKQKSNIKRSINSVEKTMKPVQNSLLYNQMAMTTTNPIHDERFCFQITEPAKNQQGESIEQNLYWSYDISNQVANEYQRKIIFREQQYFVRSDGGAPYQTIYIAIDGVQGLKNKQGLHTTKVCALHLSAVSSLVDDSGQTVYDLLYKQVQDCAWEIPMNIPTIRLRIYCDEELKSGQLGVPLICQFDVRHVSR